MFRTQSFTPPALRASAFTGSDLTSSSIEQTWSTNDCFLFSAEKRGDPLSHPHTNKDILDRSMVTTRDLETWRRWTQA